MLKLPSLWPYTVMLTNTWLLAVIKCLAVCVLSSRVVASASSSWALSQASQSLLGGPVPPGVSGYLIVLNLRSLMGSGDVLIL